MRYIQKYIEKDLSKKMVFLGGPRQVGKTTLAKNFLESQIFKGRYFNWDYDEDRQDIRAKKWAESNHLLIFDELHKFPHWKNWIKGIYDVFHKKHLFLVTGSARLDIYKRGGDSLLGRYHYWRLHPFTLDEIPDNMEKEEAFARLMKVGGFPEPFLDGNEEEARRWRRERLDKVLREDIRDLESIRHISHLSLFVDLLRNRVGGMVTLSNLAQDIQVSYQTLASWLNILENMYLVFRVLPYSKSIPRAVLKPPKVYFFDNADVKDDLGSRFENLIATALLKRIHFLEDSKGFRYELRYIRDKEGREVDFVIIKEGVIEELIEVKFSDESLSKHLYYYTKKLKPKKATQIVAQIKRSYSKDNIDVVSPLEYFGTFFKS